MTVYVLTGAWSTDTAHDTFVEVYDSLNKALEQLRKQVADEYESAWFKSLADKTISECPGYWEVYQDEFNYARYEVIAQEVQ